MGIMGFFGGGAPEELEKKGDVFFERGDFGRAKMMYEKSIDKCGKKNKGGRSLEARLLEKVHRSREALARRHREEGLEIMDSGYYEAAGDCFRLALDLTGDRTLRDELQKLLEEMASKAAPRGAPTELDTDLFDGGTEGPPDQGEDSDEIFGALVSGLPVAVKEAFYAYGPAFKQGYAALNQGDFETAKAMLSQALDENPQRFFILPELATAYLNLGMDQKALDAAEEFLNNPVDVFHAYPAICEVLWSVGEFDKALDWLDASPESIRDSLAVVLLRGETFLNAGRLDQAEEYLKHALDVFGMDPEIVKTLALVHEAQERKEDARELYRQIMSTCQTCSAPPDPMAKRKYADLSFELGDRSSGTLEIYLSLVQENPAGRKDYYNKISQIYESMNNMTEAERFKSFSKNINERN